MNGKGFQHIPVLAGEVLDLLAPARRPPEYVVDGTLGGGGHSSLILQKWPSVQLLGLDRDENALQAASERLAFAESRVHLCKSRFSELADRVREIGWNTVDAVLLDIGVSSPQIDDPERGFSFRNDGPLDMRMDQSTSVTAAELVNTLPFEELARIFREYGEIREAGRLAARIVERRKTHPFGTCFDLAEVCDDVLRKRGGRRSGPPAPTLAFQALRIAVNGELDELKQALDAAVRILAPGGRLVVISFHSLEDRIVKHFFQDMALLCKCPPKCPVCICGWTPKLRILTKSPVTASDGELERNPRAGCARLRCAERTEYEFEAKTTYRKGQ